MPWCILSSFHSNIAWQRRTKTSTFLRGRNFEQRQLLAALRRAQLRVAFVLRYLSYGFPLYCKGGADFVCDQISFSGVLPP
jgi:hypothetical protein